MSPCGTSAEPGLLEHPAEAFDYYRREGAPRVICEEKHMGSRAVVIVCRDEDAARERFGVEGESGLVVTRTGRRFFDDAAMETALLDRVRAAVSAAELWDELKTTWLCLDCELMPWSAKAQALIRDQYAGVGAAATSALADETAALEAAAATGLELGIYGPEYTAPANLDRLRQRGLAGKRSLALREFALGLEALERFIRREPLRRVHECVFGVLALESEPVDPRL